MIAIRQDLPDDRKIPGIDPDRCPVIGSSPRNPPKVFIAYPVGILKWVGKLLSQAGW
jgi:hypothetical protein